MFCEKLGIYVFIRLQFNYHISLDEITCLIVYFIRTVLVFNVTKYMEYDIFKFHAHFTNLIQVKNTFILGTNNIYIHESLVYFTLLVRSLRGEVVISLAL